MVVSDLVSAGGLRQRDPVSEGDAMAAGKGEPYLFYGLPTSMFSASTRAYLRFKKLPYVERVPSMFTYMVTAKRRCGSRQAPIVIDGNGNWIADTSVIIDELERRHPEPSILPTTPRQRIASYLFELWGNEFWYPTALHTRWSHPENYPLWEADMVRMLPRFLPRGVRGVLLRNTAQKMLNAHIPNAGVVPENHEAIDRWTERQLDLLNAHFGRSPYLFGARPTLGDLGLVIPLFGHLYLDPWSRRHLIDPRRDLRAWIERTQDPDFGEGELLPEDAIAPTLEPILRDMCCDMLPFLRATLQEVRDDLAGGHDSERLPRMLGWVEQPMGELAIRRRAIPYTLWMVQRMLDALHAMSAADAGTAREWIISVGGRGFLELEIPRLRRVGLHAAIDRSAESSNATRPESAEPDTERIG